MTYEEALAFLDSLCDYERAGPRRYDTTHFDLKKFAALLARLGSPETAFPIIHIAGTKGKGSAAAMVGGALTRAGRRVGLFTSPHLRSARERVVVAGEMISADDFGRLVGDVRRAMTAAPEPNFRTYFETVLAVALLYFRERGVEVAVLEAGLGGRLDATNVCRPAVTALTTVALDHTEILGESLAAIAREKAGIFKRGVPAVTAPQEKEALAVIRDRAEEVGAPLTVVGKDVRFQGYGDGSFDYEGEIYHFHGLTPAMRGSAQAVNGAVALATLERLGDLAPRAEAARAGVEEARLRGRLEFIPGAPAFLLDVAHNAAAAAELAAALKGFGHAPKVLVWGMSADKDARAFASAVGGGIEAVVVTAARHPRATPAEVLVAAARGLCWPVEVTPGVGEALERARALAGAGGLVVVAGSFYVVGEALAALEGEVP